MSQTDIPNINLNVNHENQFPRRIDNSFMNVLSLNIQSLRNKLIDLSDYIQTSKIKFHIIVLTETHLRDNETKLFNIPKYDVQHCVRKSGRFGGVSIFVHQDFSPFNIIHSLDFEMNNSLLIKLTKFNLHIAAFYHCRDSNFDNFLHHLDFVLDNYNNCYIFGDFNTDLCKLETDLKVKKYHDLVTSNGFFFLNSFSKSMATRVDKRRETATCIDHILTDSIFHNSSISFDIYIDDLYGDHKAILLSVKNPKVKNISNPSYFEFKKIDHAKIISQDLISQVSVNNFDEFQQDLKHIFQSNTKIYRKKEKFRKPYMNLETLNYIQIKKNYQKLLKRYPFVKKVQERFIYYRNLVTKKISKLKKNFYDKQFELCKDDPKKTWREINNILTNKSNPPPSNSITSIKVNNYITNNKIKIAENFNSFFTTIVDSIHSEIVIDQNTFNFLHNQENYNIQYEFQCPPTSQEEVLTIISNLSNSGAEDLNGFSNKLFKKYKISLSEPLAQLINTCLQNKNFPKCLKVAKVKPLFKNGDKQEMNNYRPVAISPIDSKIFESVLLSRIEDHLTRNEIICKYQFGYTKKSNCETAVLHVMNQIYSNLENKLITCAVFIDLSKAFDSLHHPLLINKLEKLKFSFSFLSLLKSYLSDRSQYVQIDDAKSQLLRIDKGVFQGSKLASTLFLIYINSIFNLPLNGKLFLYADDIALVYGEADITNLKSKIEYDLNVLDIWFSNHFLKMNTNKTNYVLFHGKTKLDYFTSPSLRINLNGKLIQRVDSFKYLGFWIDEELNFQTHIKHIKSKIIPMTFAIRRIRPFISEATAKKLYFAHIQSHLLYMNPFWNIANDSQINSLAVAQRKSLRNVFNRYSYSPSSELFSEQILPLCQLNQYNLLLLAFKITHDLLVNNVELKLISQVHSYNTRQRNHFYVEKSHTRYGFSNFFTRGLIAYNNLETRIKNIHTIARFKRELKSLLLEEYLETGN